MLLSYFGVGKFAIRYFILFATSQISNFKFQVSNFKFQISDFIFHHNKYISILWNKDETVHHRVLMHMVSIFSNLNRIVNRDRRW
jgi:hypothetical protein